MRTRLAKLNRTQALVLIVGLLFALAWAAPSVGAEVGKVARLALGRANEAVYNADRAINASDSAKSTANAASTTADAARAGASSAQAAASTAQSTANNAQSAASQALAKANSIVTASYARMNQPCNTSSACSIDHAKGVTAIRQTSTSGVYCVTATGRSPGGFSPASWLVSVDAGDTDAANLAAAMPDSGGSGCNAGEFKVQTSRAGLAASDVAFFVVIP
jgi:hypothetical protein